MYIEIENKHPDIIFLERRLKQLVKSEEYERAVIIKRWLDELTIHHHGIFITNEHQKNHKRRTS